MSLILDLVIILIIALCVFIGIKRGAVKEIVSLIGIVVALILAITISKIGATFIYNRFVGEAIYNTVYKAVEDKVGEDISTTIDALPEEIFQLGDAIGVDISEKLESGLKEDTNLASSVAEIVSESIAKPLVITIIQLVLFIILFVVFKVLIGWLGKILNIVSKLPVLGTANKLVGGIVGLLKAVIIASIVCYVVIIILKVQPDGFAGINQKIVEDTKIFNLISGIVK